MAMDPKKAIRDFPSVFALVFTHWTELMGGVIAVLGVFAGAALEPKSVGSIVAFAMGVIAGLFVVFRVGYRNLDLERRLTPNITADCGDEVPNGMSRNNDLHFQPPGNINWMPQLTYSVDFFNAVITNTGADPIIDCRAELLNLKKDGAIIWLNHSALSFEPRGKEPEPVNLVTMPGETTRNFCLCSIRADGIVMHSALNQNWRNQQLFSDFFASKGEYIFTVEISGIGSATKVFEFALDWTGVKSTSKLRKL